MSFYHSIQIDVNKVSALICSTHEVNVYAWISFIENKITYLVRFFAVLCGVDIITSLVN